MHLFSVFLIVVLLRAFLAWLHSMSDEEETAGERVCQSASLLWCLCVLTTRRVRGSCETCTIDHAHTPDVSNPHEFVDVFVTQWFSDAPQETPQFLCVDKVFFLEVAANLTSQSI